MKKLLLLGGILSSAIMLGACNASVDTSGENVLKGKDGFELNEGQALKGISDIAGVDVFKSSLVFSMLEKEFTVNKTEISSGLDELNKTYAQYGGIDYIKEYYSYSDEDLNNVVKRQILMDKALMKYKNVTEDDFKKYFEDNKTGKVALEVYVPLGEKGATKEEVAKVKSLLKPGVTAEDIESLGIEGVEIKNDVEFKKAEMTDMADLFKTPVGDVFTYEDEKMTVFELVSKDTEYKYDDLIEIIKTKLIYNDESPEVWLFEKLLKTDKSYTLSEEYSYLLEGAKEEEKVVDPDTPESSKEREEKSKEDVK